MAKPKTGVSNKAQYSRVSYLYQAAAYLASQKHSEVLVTDANGEVTTKPPEHDGNSKKALQAATRHLVKDLRAVSQKVQLRISPAMKHSICKNCDTMLIDGDTCTSEVENQSKGGKKPWADVLVRKCNVCGSARRFPLVAERQKRRPYRSAKEDMDVDTQDIKAG